MASETLLPSVIDYSLFSVLSKRMQSYNTTSNNILAAAIKPMIHTFYEYGALASPPLMLACPTWQKKKSLYCGLLSDISHCHWLVDSLFVSCLESSPIFSRTDRTEMGCRKESRT